ncbi:MAG: Calx-beta domain-containing protein [Vicinamibacteria bacterium]
MRAILAAALIIASADGAAASGTPQTVTIQWTAPADGVLEGDPSYQGVVVARTSDAAPLAATATVQFATAPGTATAADFDAESGTVTFPAGSASETFRGVRVRILDDLLDEPDVEIFTIALSGAAGAVIGSPAVQEVWISDDDPLPSVSVYDCAVVEGDAGTTPCAFPVRLFPASGRTVSVSYATVASTATEGTDFLPASGVLTFAPGVTSAAVPVAIVGDTTPEGDESLGLVLSAPVSATVFQDAADGAIVDDDLAVLPAVELTHGARVRGDLDGGAPDFFRMHQPPQASFEVMLDEAAGGAGLVLERVANDGTTVLQTAAAVGTGSARSLRWANDLPVAAGMQYVRVRATGCGTACGPADTYRLRAYETTARIPRFNNTGGQGTVLFLQNRAAVPVSARASFWNASGVVITAHGMTVPARGLAVVDTTTVPGGQGQSGSVTIAHDGGYGGLAGKAALVDPVNGFSFDAEVTSRDR